MAPVALAAPLVLMAHRRLPQAVAVMAARASTDFGLARCLLATVATVVLAVPVEMPVLEASGVLAGAVQLMGRLVK